MPRNASGSYSLPAGNPVISDTLIEADNWANPTMADLGAELTDSLSRSGKGSMTAALGVVDGIVTDPGVRFVSETGSGIYRDSAGVWWLVVLGVGVVKLSAAAMEVVGTLITNGILTVKVTTAGEALLVESTEESGASGPELRLYRNSASPEDGDAGGAVRGSFNTSDGAGGVTNFNKDMGSFDFTLVTALDGSESARARIRTAQDGNILATRFHIGNGMYSRSLTDMGDMTINSVGYFINGNIAAVEDFAFSIPGTPEANSSFYIVACRSSQWKSEYIPAGLAVVAPSGGTMTCTLNRTNANGVETVPLGVMSWTSGTKQGVWVEDTGNTTNINFGHTIKATFGPDNFGAENVMITVPSALV